MCDHWRRPRHWRGHRGGVQSGGRVAGAEGVPIPVRVRTPPDLGGVSDSSGERGLQVAETCRTNGAADVEVYPTDLADGKAVDKLAAQLLDAHKV